MFKITLLSSVLLVSSPNTFAITIDNNECLLNLEKRNQKLQNNELVACKRISLAKRYFELSTLHDTNKIELMFADDIQYSSPKLSELKGKKAVIDAQKGFFQNNPLVRWRIDQTPIYSEEEHRVTIKFTLLNCQCDHDNCRYTESQGTEHVEFNEDNKISKILIE